MHAFSWCNFVYKIIMKYDLYIFIDFITQTTIIVLPVVLFFCFSFDFFCLIYFIKGTFRILVFLFLYDTDPVVLLLLVVTCGFQKKSQWILTFGSP